MNLFNTTGVTGDAEAVLAAPVFVIPTNDPLRVTIEYDVETYDPKLTSEYLGDARTHGSSIKNTLTANIMSGPSAITMVAGKQYTIKLHLGLTSVKADATVTLWDPDAKSANVDLIPVPNGGE